MKELIKNKWIILFAVFVIGIFYIGAESPRNFEDINSNENMSENL